MSAGVRTRIWAVLTDWYYELLNGSILMTWADTGASGGLAFSWESRQSIVAHDAMLLVRRPLPESEQPEPIPPAL